jgi:hypothetical protein
MIGKPFSDTAAEAAQDAMFFRGSHPLEVGEGVSKKCVIERLYGMKAYDTGRAAFRCQQIRRLEAGRKHVTCAENTDVGAFSHGNGLADGEVGGGGMDNRLTFLADAHISRVCLS